jgi:hypothetical protein
MIFEIIAMLSNLIGILNFLITTKTGNTMVNNYYINCNIGVTN